MRESLKGILLYNKYFPNNHKTLGEECKELERQGKLEMRRQCDALTLPEDVEKLGDDAGVDALDLFNRSTAIEVQNNDVSLEELFEDVVKNPQKYLTSVISVGYYEPGSMYTRIDCGVPELQYLINSEKRSPKGN